MQTSQVLQQLPQGRPFAGRLLSPNVIPLGRFGGKVSSSESGGGGGCGRAETGGNRRRQMSKARVAKTFFTLSPLMAEASQKVMPQYSAKRDPSS